MSDRIDRFQKRKTLVATQSVRTQLSLVSQNEVVVLDESVDETFLATLAAMDGQADIAVGREEVEALLQILADEHSQTRFEDMLSECKRGIVQSIAGPFGVGGLVSAYDRVGGNVDTIQNVRKGVWATDEEQQKYESRGEYNSTPYHAHRDYTKKNADVSKRYKNGGVADSYTGDQLAHGTGKPNLDHVISANETHDDAAIYLAGLNPTDVANRPDNLEPTEESINKSKKQSSATEFLERLERQRNERQQTIATLEAKGTLTEKEHKLLQKLKKLEKVDEERVKEADGQARDDRDRLVNKTYYGSRKFAVNTLKTSAAEGAKMGLQQAIGAALTEFFVACMDEVRDWYLGGRKDIAFARRLKRVADRIAERWKDILSAAMTGALSGFLSNLVTVLINVFLTTQKRVVRMIREGAFSMVRALKMIVVRPEKMTLREAIHEASKLVLAGGIVIGGVALEEVIVRQLQAFGLGLVADIATAAIVGTIVAIAIALSAYTIDRLDLLGVQEEKRQTHIIGRLDENIFRSIQETESLLRQLQGLNPIPA